MVSRTVVLFVVNFPNIDKIVVLENALFSDFLDLKPDAAIDILRHTREGVNVK